MLCMSAFEFIGLKSESFYLEVHPRRFAADIIKKKRLDKT